MVDARAIDGDPWIRFSGRNDLEAGTIAARFRTDKHHHVAARAFYAGTRKKCVWNLPLRFTTRAAEIDGACNRRNRHIVRKDGRVDQLHELDQPVELVRSTRADTGTACTPRFFAVHKPRIDAFG